MELYLGDGVIFWEYLIFGVSTFDFLYLDMYLDMCFVLWTYVLCDMYLVLCFEVGMNLCACMWYMCCVSNSLTIHPSTTYIGGWR